jgi:hypothetical protein
MSKRVTVTMSVRIYVPVEITVEVSDETWAEVAAGEEDFDVGDIVETSVTMNASTSPEDVRVAIDEADEFDDLDKLVAEAIRRGEED